ncbi:MAG: 6,7-dimethyl-8-ribityllumazine synthase, partial [Pseudomonadota bacterium]|nr:6,7-dimethyl-8-ribityllumazine synthase [Pseudomonadota bacterium]
MNRVQKFSVGIVRTSWYEEKIEIIVNEITKHQYLLCEIIQVPGSLELAQAGKRLLQSGKPFDALIFCGIVVRGQTSHYELVTTETFRSIGSLALEYPEVRMINNVFCVENKRQLENRIQKNTSNNVEALISSLVN